MREVFNRAFASMMNFKEAETFKEEGNQTVLGDFWRHLHQVNKVNQRSE